MLHCGEREHEVVREALDVSGDLLVETTPDRGCTDHVAIWSELGEAEKRAGHFAEARPWLEQVQGSGVQMVQAPLAWVRALYHLADLEREAGETEMAADLYRQFLRLRPAGGLDTDLVERANAALDGLTARR